MAPQSSSPPLIRRLRHITLVLSLVHAALGIFHVVALGLAAISCPLSPAYRLAHGAEFIALPLLLPLWVIALVSLARERRFRALAAAVAGIAAIVVCAQPTFALSLFYCDGDAPRCRAALDWHAH